MKNYFVVVPLVLLVGVGLALAVPPTTEKIQRALMLGIGQTEQVLRTDAASTTPEAAFATDLTTAQQTDAYTQEILIRNSSTDLGGVEDLLCVGLLAWSAGGGATCQLKCAAATITCSAAATDGEHVAGRETWNRTLDGTSCVCVVGSAATSEYQSTRVVR